MQRSTSHAVIENFKTFYARPMEQVLDAFLEAKPESYENLMRRVHHSNNDKAFLHEYIEAHYGHMLNNQQQLKELTPGELTLLGLAYEDGWLGEENYQQARLLYKIAAKRRNATALLRLGWLFENGLGGKKNYNSAKKYYERAQENGNTTALVRLGELYLSEKIAIPLSANVGFRDGDYIINFAKIFKKFNAMADLHFTAATVRGNIEIIIMLIRGVETPTDDLKVYCKKAASAGVAGSMVQLGAALLAEGAPIEEACLYFEATADAGHIAGLEALCWASEEYNFYEDYHDKISHYAHKFFELGNYTAAFYLARLYEGSEALHYYRLAAEFARTDIRKKARKELLQLYKDTNDPSAFYHQCLFPVRRSTQGVAKVLNREFFLKLAHEQPMLLKKLAQTYKDTWGKVMLLFDPEINITPSVQLACRIQLPREIVGLIINKLNLPNFQEILFIKSLMYDELSALVLAIFSRKWLERQDRQCNATITLQSKNNKYVKRVPAPELEKWEICHALRNGTALFSVNEGLSRIKMIEQRYPELYPKPLK